MNVPILAVIVLIGSAWAILWISPNALNWVAAKCLARRDGILATRLAFVAHLRRFEEDR